MMPRLASPMLFSACSVVTSPDPRILVFRGSMPRSWKALPSAAGWMPPGTKMKIASGFTSLARCTKAEKSGLATGNRTAPMLSPPASLKARWNSPSASWPGEKSDTMGGRRGGQERRGQAHDSEEHSAHGPLLAGGVAARLLLLRPCLERVLDVLDLVELDVQELATDLLHPADVHGLDDVA